MDIMSSLQTILIYENNRNEKKEHKKSACKRSRTLMIICQIDTQLKMLEGIKKNLKES